MTGQKPTAACLSLPIRAARPAYRTGADCPGARSLDLKDYRRYREYPQPPPPSTTTTNSTSNTVVRSMCSTSLSSMQYQIHRILISPREVPALWSYAVGWKGAIPVNRIDRRHPPDGSERLRDLRAWGAFLRWRGPRKTRCLAAQGERRQRSRSLRNNWSKSPSSTASR
jgi:hypothetical protein